MRPHEACERADVFRRRRISAARTSRIEFEQQFQRDQEEFEQQVGHSWRRAELD